MNRIVLIGNGFDLAHGLKTKYEDFVNWYWEYRVKSFENEGTNISKDILCTIEDKYGQSWNANYYYGYNLNQETGKQIVVVLLKDKDRFRFTYSPFFSKICKSIETKGWVDIENEYYNLLKQYSIDEFSRENIINLNLQLKYIQDSLIQYLSIINQTSTEINNDIWKKIYSPIDPKDISVENFFQLRDYIDWCVKQEIGFWENKMANYQESFSSDLIDNYKAHHHEVYYTEYPRPFMLPDHIMILSFNYTRTPHLYHNQNFYLNYIHGELEEPHNIIFGYGDEIDKNYQVLRNLNENVCLQNIKTIKYLETDRYRNALAFMDSAPFQVHIMGHSCGNSDRTLLNTLFEHKNCISIKPFYYIKKDGTDNYLDLIQNICRNFTDMKLMRDRVVNKMYCEPLTK